MKSGAAVQAAKLLDEYGVEHPEHIRVEDIAYDLGLEIVIGETKSCAAQLTAVDGKGRIRLPPNLDDGRRRFGIAHEIGHFRLHARRRSRGCTASDLADWSPNSGAERDANIFAVELLMPARLAGKYCDVDRPALRHVQKLADVFTASLTASALRLAELTAVACAVALVENGRIRWIVPNEEFWPRVVDRGSTVDPLSRAAHATNSADGLWDVPASCWIEDHRFPSTLHVREDSVRLGRTHVLSIISFAGIDPPES